MSKINLKSRRTALLATTLVGLGVFALSGCGGDKVSGSVFGSTPAASPVVAGLEPTAAVSPVSNSSYQEVSGLASTDGTVGYATAATASTAVPLPANTASGSTTIPLGFAPGGAFITGDYASAAVANGTTQYVFRAALINGQQSNGNVVAIDPNKVTVSSPDIPGFATQNLTFNSALSTGPLANALYASSPFTLPASLNSGLYTFVVSATDTANTSSTTTFKAVVIKPTQSAVLVQIIDADGNPISGATASITNSTGTGQTTADTQGMVVLFSTPGNQTITIVHGASTTTSNVTLTAGQLLATSGTDPLQITSP